MIVLLLLLLTAYLYLVRRLRYQRIIAIHTAYAKSHSLTAVPPLSRPLSSAPSVKDYPMTPHEAQSILSFGGAFEFPYAVKTSLAFALFKTYGIESISALLLQTGELSVVEKSSRRFMDTSLIINTFMDFPLNGPGSGATVDDPSLPLDPRSAIAIARMNYIHNLYKSKISNSDLLYTLSVFILSPSIWCAKYEYRSMTPLEEIAWFTFFAEVGRRMNIEGIPKDLPELIEWSEEYERENMLPSKTCAKVSAPTIKLLLHFVPKGLHEMATVAVSALLEPRLRNSILLPAPSPLIITLVTGLLKVRGFLIRNLFLPRISPSKHVASPFDVPHTLLPPSTTSSVQFAPKSFALKFENVPYYVPIPSPLSSSLLSFLLQLGILREDQVPSKKWKAEGFRLEDLGPERLEGKGWEEVRMEAERLLGGKAVGAFAVGGMTCPMR